MDKKYLKLGILGLAVFLVILGAFIVFVLPKGPSSTGTASNYVAVTPLFAKQFFEQNPDFKPSQEGNTGLEVMIKTERLALSENGFVSVDLVISSAAPIRITNDSSQMRGFSVLSKGMDGKDYEVESFVLPAGKEAVLTLLVGPYLNEILASGKVKVEKAAQGIPVCELACTSGCSQENSLLEIYYA
jgi:hypothetical protein